MVNSRDVKSNTFLWSERARGAIHATHHFALPKINQKYSLYREDDSFLARLYRVTACRGDHNRKIILHPT